MEGELVMLISIWRVMCHITGCGIVKQPALDWIKERQLLCGRVAIWRGLFRTCEL
jgi:hypothetical protein